MNRPASKLLTERNWVLIFDSSENIEEMFEFTKPEYNQSHSLLTKPIFVL